MKKFARLYRWELNNELYASIYFAAMLSIYSIIVLIHGERSVDIFIMLEMLIACYIISVFQRKVFEDDSRYTGKSLIVRSLLWHMFSILLVVGSCFVFNWFQDLQGWAMGVFIASMVACFIFVWIGVQLVNKMDTKELNDQLSHYQKVKNKGEES